MLEAWIVEVDDSTEGEGREENLPLPKYGHLVRENFRGRGPRPYRTLLSGKIGSSYGLPHIITGKNCPVYVMPVRVPVRPEPFF